MRHYGRLKDKVAIITGSGGRGIGKEIAKGFVKEGAKVAIAELRLNKLEETRKELEALGGEAISMYCDICDPENCTRLVQETVKHFGRLDILVNVAAIFPNDDFLDCTPEEWRKVIDIDLNGTFFMCKAALPQMLEQKSGNIINFTTAYVRMGQGMFTHYAAAKAGVMMVTRAIAADFGQQGIRCNAISPGYTPGTEGAIPMGEEFEREWLKTIPLGRKAENDEYVGTAIFLASEESAFMTGQNLSVDGGMTMP